MQDYHELPRRDIDPRRRLPEAHRRAGGGDQPGLSGRRLLLVCILRGGVMFLTDLMRKITVPITIDFMSVSSYGLGAGDHRAKCASPWTCNTDIRRKNVLLVEDIVDSGYTIGSVLELLETRHPQKLESLHAAGQSRAAGSGCAHSLLRFCHPG